MKAQKNRTVFMKKRICFCENQALDAPERSHYNGVAFQ